MNRFSQFLLFPISTHQVSYLFSEIIFVDGPDGAADMLDIEVGGGGNDIEVVLFGWWGKPLWLLHSIPHRR